MVGKAEVVLTDYVWDSPDVERKMPEGICCTAIRSGPPAPAAPRARR